MFYWYHRGNNKKEMVIKPGLIGNGRKIILGDGALRNFGKNCALQKLNLDKRKPAHSETGR